MLRCAQDGLLTKLSQHGTEKQALSPGAEAVPGHCTRCREPFCSGILQCVSPLFCHSPVASCAPWPHCLDIYLQQSLKRKGWRWEWQPGCRHLDKDKNRNSEGAGRGPGIKICRDQRKDAYGLLTALARQRLRCEVVSLGGTCPSVVRSRDLTMRRKQS